MADHWAAFMNYFNERCDEHGVPCLVQRLRITADYTGPIVEARYFDGQLKKVYTRVPTQFVVPGIVTTESKHEAAMFWLQAEADAERA